MTEQAANSNTAPKSTGFHLNKYSFIVKDFAPTLGKYPFETKNDKVYVNLTTYEQRVAFFADLKEKNIRAREAMYEYFVPASHQLNGQNVTFLSLVAYLKEFVDMDETTKNLKRCFKVVNDNANFKVIVSSYHLASRLNEKRVFYPYRRNNRNGFRSDSGSASGSGYRRNFSDQQVKYVSSSANPSSYASRTKKD